jgi:hypothetical protein
MYLPKIIIGLELCQCEIDLIEFAQLLLTLLKPSLCCSLRTCPFELAIRAGYGGTVVISSTATRTLMRSCNCWDSCSATPVSCQGYSMSIKVQSFALGYSPKRQTEYRHHQYLLNDPACAHSSWHLSRFYALRHVSVNARLAIRCRDSTYKVRLHGNGPFPDETAF